MRQQNPEWDVIKWQGIKNCDDKKVYQGYLWIKFKQPITLCNINPNVIGAVPKSYATGQQIGFSVKASSRLEAVAVFNRDHQICH